MIQEGYQCTNPSTALVATVFHDDVTCQDFANSYPYEIRPNGMCEAYDPDGEATKKNSSCLI